MLVRRLSFFAFVLTSLGLLACAPIRSMTESGERDGSSTAAVDITNGQGGTTADAGSSGATPAAATPGYRAACGDVSACNPDDPFACTPPSPLDGGADAANPSPAGARACRAYATRDVSECVPAGAGRLHDPCLVSDECAAGLECVEHACAATCCARSTTCPDGTNCVLARGETSEHPWIPVCGVTVGCAFETASPCGPRTQCGFAEEDAVRACVPVGTTAETMPCDGAPCAEGLACVGSGLLRRCARLCRPGTTTCAPSDRCRLHPALLGTSDIGYCAP